MFFKPILDKNNYIDFESLDAQKLISLEKEFTIYYKKTINQVVDIEQVNFNNFIQPLIKINQEFIFFEKLCEYLDQSGNFKNLSFFLDQLTFTYNLMKFENNNSKLLKKLNWFYVNKRKHNLNNYQLIQLEDFYNSFKKQGAFLSKTKKTLLLKLDKQIIEYSEKFYQNNIKEEKYKNISIPTNELTKDELIQVLKLNPKKTKNSLIVNLTNHNAFFLIENIKSLKIRKKVSKIYSSIGLGKNKFNNVKIVKKLIEFKHRKAKLLGYKHYADFISNNQIEKKVFDNTQHKVSFLQKLLEESNIQLNNYEKPLINKLAKNIGFEKDVSYYDLRLLNNEIGNKHLKNLSSYFSLNNTLNSIFKFSKKMLNIEFKYIKFNKTKNIYTYEILKNKKSLGLIHLDLFYNKNKIHGCSLMEIRELNLINDKVEFCIITDFKKNKKRETLLNFEDIQNIYHEFGHLFETLLSQNKKISVELEKDVIEFSSLLFESLLQDKEFIQSWARHYKTNKKIPLKILNHLKTDYTPISANMLDIVISLIDLKIHSTNPNKIKNLRNFELDFYNKLQIDHNFLFNYNKSYLASIEHLCSNYSGNYYSYVLAIVYQGIAYKQLHKLGYKNWNVFFKKYIKFCSQINKKPTELIMSKLLKRNIKNNISLKDWFELAK